MTTIQSLGIILFFSFVGFAVGYVFKNEWVHERLLLSLTNTKIIRYDAGTTTDRDKIKAYIKTYNNIELMEGTFLIKSITPTIKINEELRSVISGATSSVVVADITNTDIKTYGLHEKPRSWISINM